MSRAVDLFGEYRAALAAVTPRLRRRFGELSLIAPVHKIGLVGFARVSPRDGSLYELDADGAAAVIFPAWDGPIASATEFLTAPDRLIDLVAWLPRDPSPLLTRRGVAAVLGGEHIAGAHISGDPLRLYSDPASWARGGDGAVVIDWTIDVGLLGLKVIIVDNVEHGVGVRARLKKLRARMIRQLPQIRVPAASLEAALGR